MALFGLSRRNGTSGGQSRGGKTGKGATISRVRVDSGYFNVAALDSRSVTITGLDRDFIKGQRIHFSFVLDVGGETVEIPTRGTVHRVNGNQVTTTFLAPQPYYQRYLKQAASAHPSPKQRQR